MNATALVGWLAMASVGAVRQHRDGRWYVDFGHSARVWSVPVGTIKLALTEELARRVLERIRGEVSEGRDLADVLAQFQPASAKPNLVATRLERWLEVKRREVAAGDRSPTYLAELERYARDGGHFSFWTGRSIHEVNYGALEDWSHWLADRGLGPKSRWNVLAAFHAFLGWLYKRQELREMPRSYPWPKLSESEPSVLSIVAQRAVLEAIPDDRRGIFLAMALLGIRPSEAVALRQSDVRDGWLTVSRARKGAKLDAPVAGTKSGAVKRLPVPEELREWIEKRVGNRVKEDTTRTAALSLQQGADTSSTLRRDAGNVANPLGGPYLDPARHRPIRFSIDFRAPLFPNPTTGQPWAKSALRRTWAAACEKCGVRIGLYNGTKHTMATDAIARGVPERSLQAMLGHANAKSTRRYARLQDSALIDVLGRGR